MPTLDSAAIPEGGTGEDCTNRPSSARRAPGSRAGCILSGISGRGGAIIESHQDAVISLFRDGVRLAFELFELPGRVEAIIKIVDDLDFRRCREG